LRAVLGEACPRGTALVWSMARQTLVDLAHAQRLCPVFWAYVTSLIDTKTEPQPNVRTTYWATALGPIGPRQSGDYSSATCSHAILTERLRTLQLPQPPCIDAMMQAKCD
jgi:hypothetical protein